MAIYLYNSGAKASSLPSDAHAVWHDKKSMLKDDDEQSHISHSG